MPVGSVIVPGLRDGSFTQPTAWELVTWGLGAAGVQEGGQFKKNNPGCNCCPTLTCPTSIIRLTTSGYFTAPGDPDNCGSLNGTFDLLPIADRQLGSLPPVGTCQVALEPDCWWNACFTGPNGERWFWEIGLNGDNRATLGWVAFIALFNEIGDLKLFYTFGLDGYLPGTVGLELEDVTFNFGVPENCGNVGGGPPCLGLPGESLVGEVVPFLAADDIVNCICVTCRRTFQIDVLGIVSQVPEVCLDNALACSSLNGIYLLDYNPLAAGRPDGPCSDYGLFPPLVCIWHSQELAFLCNDITHPVPDERLIFCRWFLDFHQKGANELIPRVILEWKAPTADCGEINTGTTGFATWMDVNIVINRDDCGGAVDVTLPLCNTETADHCHFIPSTIRLRSM